MTVLLKELLKRPRNPSFNILCAGNDKKSIPIGSDMYFKSSGLASELVEWLIKEEVKGANDEDLGNVQHVDHNHIFPQKDTLNNEEKLEIQLL